MAALSQTLAPRLEQRQTQAMAPQMLASLRRLQLGREELAREVAAELMRNPALESEMDGEWRSAAGGPDAGGGIGRGGGETASASDGLSRAELERGLAPRSVADDGESASGTSGGGDPDDDWHQRQLDSLVSLPSLYEHLAAQLDGVRLPPLVRQAALQIIGGLDSNGWLMVPLADIAREAGVSLQDAEDALRAVQALDPCGIAGRGLGECLLLQLRDRGLADDSWPVRLVRDHLTDLGARVFPPRLRQQGLTEAEWQSARQLIRSLDPRPGAAFSSERAVSIVPDVEIVPLDDAPGYEARLLDDGLPRLRISRRYEEMLHDPRTGPEALAFLREKIRSGKFLMDSIEQRRTTLLRIAQLIADTQAPYLREGVSALRAVTLESAGKALGLHGTTVGRATAGKYVRTPQGVRPMRFFFTAGGVRAADAADAGAGGGSDAVALAPEAVKDEIRRLVAAENPAHPLSDAALAAALNRRGLRLARRTVAKYREQARIPSSHERRRQATGE